MASRGLLLFALLALPVLSTASCFSSGESSSFGAAAPTLVTVEPEAFLGETACGSYPGAVRTYVATLTDVTVDPPFRLASSGPIPCQVAVSFAYVVPGHGYTATIEAYDRDDLVPLGGAESGSSVMLDAATRDRVAPTWTSSCGGTNEGADAGNEALPRTVAHSSRDMRIRSCSPLVRAQQAPESRISITLSPTALGGLACGDSTGQVERYAVIPANPSLSRKEAACGESLTFEVEPGRLHSFDVQAFEAGGTEARWAGQCQATSQAGMTLPASCTPLSSAGWIRLRIGELLSQRGHECSKQDIESYDVLLRDRVVIAGASCKNDGVVGSLPPGSHSLTVVGLGRSGGKLVGKLVAHCPEITLAEGERAETSCAP